MGGRGLKEKVSSDRDASELTASRFDCWYKVEDRENEKKYKVTELLFISQNSWLGSLITGSVMCLKHSLFEMLIAQ